MSPTLFSTLLQRLAEAGYEAYRTKIGGVFLISRTPIPPFAELPSTIQEAWTAAAEGIIKELENSERYPEAYRSGR